MVLAADRVRKNVHFLALVMQQRSATAPLLIRWISNVIQ